MFICRYVFLNMLDLSAILYTKPKIARYIVMFDKQTCVLVEGCNLDLFAEKNTGQIFEPIEPSMLCQLAEKLLPGLGSADLLYLQTQWSLGDASSILASQRAVQDVWNTQGCLFVPKKNVFFFFCGGFYLCYMLSMVSDFEFFFVKWKK